VYNAVTPEALEALLKSRNTPDWLIAHQLFIAKVAAEGGFSHENTQPVKDLARREPITTKKFVEDHKAMFS
jgi:hypothetical protein